MPQLQYKTALVTGAARGIGAAIAKAFVDEGANVILTYNRDDEGKAMARALGATYHHLDVQSECGPCPHLHCQHQSCGGSDGLLPGFLHEVLSPPLRVSVWGRHHSLC